MRGLAALAVLAVLTASGLAQNFDPNAPGGLRFPAPTADGSQITVVIGSPFRIVLEADNHSPRVWNVAFLPDGIVEVREDPWFFPDPGTADDPFAEGREVWEFVALTTGECEIVFGLGPAGGYRDFEETRHFSVTVGR